MQQHIYYELIKIFIYQDNTSQYTAAVVAVLPPAKMPIRFVHASNGQLPPNAYIGGHDNGPQLIAQSYYEGLLVPGKFFHHHGVA